jgi:circadian clock protein KaiB
VNKSAPPKATRRGKVSDPPRFRLQLYISGATPRSIQAIANIKAISEKRLSGKYDLEVIDVGQQAALAREQQIIVLPTLIKRLPPPIRRIVGNLSDTDKVLVGLGLELEEPDDNNKPKDEPGAHL